MGYGFCSLCSENIKLEKKDELTIGSSERKNKNIRKIIKNNINLREKNPEIENDKIIEKNIFSERTNSIILDQFNENKLKEMNKIEQLKKSLEDQKNIFLKKVNEFERNKEKLIDEEIQKRKKPILIGLNNIGATCYMNATLQCFSNSSKLTDYFLYIYKEDKKKVMTYEYYKLIQNLWKREKNNIPYSPNSFKNVLSKENPLFAGIAANDSKDLVNFLLERFHLELNKKINNNNNNINNKVISTSDQLNEAFMLENFLAEFKTNYDSPISSLFYGILETKSKCLGCNNIKYNFQIYSFIEFPLEQVNKFCFEKGMRPLNNSDGTNPDVDLFECFDYYGKVDTMNGDNQMYCNICNQLYDAYYSTLIYSTPFYLIINLNRGKGAIYECKVNFPEQLNILNYVTYKDGPTFFQLYAVICHLGPSSMSGHFVAYCRNRIDDKWYLYNDGFVTPCNTKNQYKNGMPYILFYRALGDF